MTRRENYIKKYGPIMGPFILSRNARIAAQARWKAFCGDR